MALRDMKKNSKSKSQEVNSDPTAVWFIMDLYVGRHEDTAAVTPGAEAFWQKLFSTNSVPGRLD